MFNPRNTRPDPGLDRASWADRRDEHRHPSAIPAAVIRHPETAVITDLNCGGACIDGAWLDRGDQLLLAIGALAPRAATVCWAHNDKAGVAFRERLNPYVVAHLLRDAKTRAA